MVFVFWCLVLVLFLLFVIVKKHTAMPIMSMSVEDMFSNDKFPSVDQRFPGLSVLEMQKVVDDVYRQPPDVDLQLVDADGVWRFKRHPLTDRGLLYKPL